MEPKNEVQDWDTKELIPKPEKEWKIKYKLLTEMLYFIRYKNTEKKGLLNKSVRHTQSYTEIFYE